MKTILAAIAFGLAVASPVAAFTKKEVTFGIVPQQSASRLAKTWGPMLAELSAQTGVKFRFQTTRDIPTFEACLAAGAFDFAYMNPMHYAIFSDEAGYEALAHQDKKRLKGVIVVKADAPYTDLAGLQDQNVAFPSPGAFGASILNRASLTAEGVEFTPNYVNSHDSVYRAVAAGLMAAGGGVTRTFNSVDPEIKDQLRLIHETEGYTPHAFAVHESVDDDLAKMVQTFLVAATEAHPDLVAQIGMSGILAATDAAWNDVRNLEMDRDDTGISKAGERECPSG